MSERELRHFLVMYDIPAGHADVVQFERDYESALLAYNEAEEKHIDQVVARDLAALGLA